MTRLTFRLFPCCPWVPLVVCFLAISLPVGAGRDTPKLDVRRFEQNPIIRPEMLPDRDGPTSTGLR